MNNKRVTIYDLAKAINLSPSYISKALNNHPSVGDKMKEKVRKAAKDLNYKHNSYAANLRMGISKTIGVIVPHISWYPSVRISSDTACPWSYPISKKSIPLLTRCFPASSMIRR